MKLLAFLMLLVLLAGCGSADSSGPSGRAKGSVEKQSDGWCLTVRQAVFSPDNRFLLVAYYFDGVDGQTPLADMIPVYDLKSGERVHTFSKKDLESFLAIPGTAHILAVNQEGEPNVWDMTNGKLVRTLDKFPKKAWVGAVSKDGKRIYLSTEERGFEIWDLGKSKSIYRWPLVVISIGSPIFSPDGKQLFTHYAPDGQHGRYAVWDVATGKEATLSASREEWKKWPYPMGPHPLAFSPDGKLAVSEGWDGKKSQMVLWDWTTGKVVRKLDFQAKGKLPGYRGHMAAAFSSDGKRLIVGCGDLTLRCWEIPAGKEIWASDIEENTTQPALHAVIFSHDGDRAFTSFGGWMQRGERSLSLRVWDCTNGKQLRELPPLPDGTSGYEVAPLRKYPPLEVNPWDGVPGGPESR